MVVLPGSFVPHAATSHSPYCHCLFCIYSPTPILSPALHCACRCVPSSAITFAMVYSFTYTHIFAVHTPLFFRLLPLWHACAYLYMQTTAHICMLSCYYCHYTSAYVPYFLCLPFHCPCLLPHPAPAFTLPAYYYYTMSYLSGTKWKNSNDRHCGVIGMRHGLGLGRFSTHSTHLLQSMYTCALPAFYSPSIFMSSLYKRLLYPLLYSNCSLWDPSPNLCIFSLLCHSHSFSHHCPHSNKMKIRIGRVD